jgi:hypothetical protein
VKVEAKEELVRPKFQNRSTLKLVS